MAPEDLAAMTGEDHRRAFMDFVAALLSRFDRYTSRDSVDLARDRVKYRQTALWLTDEEFDDLAEDLRETLRTRTENKSRREKETAHTLHDLSPRGPENRRVDLDSFDPVLDPSAN